jgi:hypothetical protein
VRVPLMIAVWSGLHQGDILKLDWSEYDGAFLRVNQRKGRRHGHKPKILEVPGRPRAPAELRGKARYRADMPFQRRQAVDH